jgi:hypothetical protein
MAGEGIPQNIPPTAAAILAMILRVDGAGSNFDADLLDGQQGAYYQNLANATGVLVATKGGTEQSTYSVGDLLVGGATNTLVKLSAVATGNVLLSGGVNTSPAWGKVNVTQHITGITPVANGGTGLGEVPAGQILYGNGTSALQPSANLTFTGTTLNVEGEAKINGVLKSSHLALNDVVLSEYATNGPSVVSINYNGYNFGTAHFRGLDIYNGKNTLIASFIGSTGSLVIGPDPGGTELLRVAGAGRFNGSLTVTSGNIITSGFLRSSSTGAAELYLDRSSGLNPSRVFFRNDSLTKLNWLIGVQQNNDNSLEITRSTTSGGNTYSNPSIIFKDNGVTVIGPTDPGGTAILRGGGDIFFSGTTHTFGPNSGSVNIIAQGGNTGSGNGSRFGAWNNGTFIIQMGNKSAILGGTYSATPYLYANGALEIFATSVLMTGTLTLPASTTAAPSLVIPHGAAPTTPSDGHVWTTTAGLFARINGATVQFATSAGIGPTTLYAALSPTGIGPQSTTAETSMVPTGNPTGSLTIPANYFTVGKYLRITIHGAFTGNPATISMAIKVKIGSVILYDSSLVTLPYYAATKEFTLISEITCYQAGINTLLYNTTKVNFSNSNLLDTSDSFYPKRTTATYDGTNPAAIDVTAQFNSTTPVLKGHSITIEALN